MKASLIISSFIALIATLGSLYFSEIMGFIPCKLCWFQRILMYPIFFITISQLAYNHCRIFPSIIFSFSGMVLSSYHYALQQSWIGNQEISCSTISCGIKYINYYEFITIPFLSLVAFFLITFILLLGSFSKKNKFVYQID